MAEKAENNLVSKVKSVFASAARITAKGVRAGVLGGALLGSAFGIVNHGAKWVYQVKTNYGVVITEADGGRVAVEKSGWYGRVPFLSTYEAEYPLANQVVFLHGKVKPHEVITKDGVVIMAVASTFYSIENLRQYAIENVKMDIEVNDPSQSPSFGSSSLNMSPKEMTQRTLDSLVGGYIQKTSPERLIHDRQAVEKEILELLVNSDTPKRYGIKINGFNFTDTSYIPHVVAANAEKQRLVALAEGKYAAALEEKKAIETLSHADAENYKILEKALNPRSVEEKQRVMEIFRSLVKYRVLKDRSGDTTWIVPEGNVPMPVYSPAGSETNTPVFYPLKGQLLESE